MKRFSKLKNKKGFTLLETLLATCILVIVSSMLMQGFITAMGYSYNSSVYSRSASYNSRTMPFFPFKSISFSVRKESLTTTVLPICMFSINTVFHGMQGDCPL